MGRRKAECVVECFWPGVRESDLRALDERAYAIAAELAGRGEDVRYLGSLLFREDDLVFCNFEGSKAAVRHAAEEARIPFERILDAGSSPWPSDPEGQPKR